VSVGECHHAARKGSTAVEVGQGRESGPMVGPIHRHLGLVEPGLVLVVEVEEHPTVEQLVHELTQAGTPEDECREGLAQRHSELPQTIVRFEEAEDEP
jgi:hypothetical protein